MPDSIIPKFQKYFKNHSLLFTNDINPNDLELQKEIAILVNNAYAETFAHSYKEPSKYRRFEHEPKNVLPDSIKLLERFCLFDMANDGKLLGTVRLTTPILCQNPSTKKYELTTEMGLMAVHVDFKRRGYSNLMLNSCKDIFRKLKNDDQANRLVLQLLRPGTSDDLPFDFLYRWYEKNGFVEIHRSDVAESERYGALYSRILKYEDNEFADFEFRG